MWGKLGLTVDDNRLERLDPKGCPPLGRKSHPSYRIGLTVCDVGQIGA